MRKKRKKIKIKRKKKIGKKKIKKRLKKKAKRKIKRRKKKRILRKKKIKISRRRHQKIFSPEKIQQLIEKGKERGFVTVTEILYFFPEIEKDIKGLDFLYETLEKEGIEVKEDREFLKV